MSSGEGAKPTSYEERNPFDISRRSQNEVAAEIAERMAAWKRARGRSYAASPAPGTPPSSPVASKAPVIAAPVQPARLPKFGEQAARAAMPASEAPSRPSGLPVPPRPRGEAGTAGARVSTPAASATAVQRAMPPAPALRPPAAPTEPVGLRAEAQSGLPDVPARPAEAGPVPDDVSPRGAPPGEELAGAPTAGDSHAMEDAMTAPAARAGTAPDAPRMATTSGVESSDRDERPADAAEADGSGLDRLVAEAAAQAPGASNPEAGATKADQAEAREPAAPGVKPRANMRVPPGLDRPGPDRHAAEAAGADGSALAASMPGAAGPDVLPSLTPDPVMPHIDALAAEMHEAELMARTRAATAALAQDGEAARAVPRKPLFDPRGARKRASQADAPARLETEAAAHDGGRAPETADAMPAAAEPGGELHGTATVQPGASSFEALDREAYRIGSPKIESPAVEARAAEPQIAPAGEESDRSKARDQVRGAGAPGDAAVAAAAAASESQAAEGRASAPAGATPAAPPRRLRIAAPAPLIIEPPQARMEPRGIELPSIETRIEARRIGTLRADPWIAGRRPIFPHIQPEAWNVPGPAVASRARRQHGGTGWAIGLGALLLIAGITAPAAIWQGRQAHPGDEDQVATLAPPPASKTASQAAPQAASQAQPDASRAPASPAPSANAPDQPQRAAPPPPASQTAAGTPSSPPPEPQVGSAAQEEETADRPAEQAALAPVHASGELNKAPVTSPPPRSSATPAGKAVAKAEPPAEPLAEPDRAFSPVARPFVPDAVPKPTPFRPESSPGTAVASVPANGASVPIDGSPESVALKPSLIGQLKPQAAANAAGAAPQRAAGKPRTPYPQPLDQMFQNLINTLSSGQPVNSSSKPIPPSTRR